MIRRSREGRPGRGGFPRERVFLALVLTGLALNLHLLYRHAGEGGTAGCGGGPCAQVLASRWSVVFGLPVTAFGTLVYLGLMAGPVFRGARPAVPLLGAVLGSAVWFLFVQAVLIGEFCPWCLAAHGVGLAAVWAGSARPPVSLVRWAAAAFLTIGLAQVYGPAPATHRMEEGTASAAGRPVREGGGDSIAAAALPRLGRVDARHVMVEYFDYQCPSCRIMSGYLAALVDKHPADICVLLMPVPLDPVCNDSFLPGDVGHPDSCGITRIALAVWRENPEGFPAFHREVLSNPALTLPDILSLARRQVTRARLDVALDEPWIDELIAAGIADWVSFSGKTKALPKLLIRDKRMLHGLPSGEAEFIRAVEHELGL